MFSMYSALDEFCFQILGIGAQMSHAVDIFSDGTPATLWVGLNGSSIRSGWFYLETHQRKPSNSLWRLLELSSKSTRPKSKSSGKIIFESPNSCFDVPKPYFRDFAFFEVRDFSRPIRLPLRKVPRLQPCRLWRELQKPSERVRRCS